jgi:hypothetical protein
MARSSYTSKRNGPGGSNHEADPFSFARNILDFQRQFLGFAAPHAIPDDKIESPAPTGADPLQVMSTMLNAYTQMLGLSGLATETMRFATRQAQTQVEYMQALRACRDWAEIGSVNMEFTRRIVQESNAQLQQLASATQRLMEQVNQASRT